MDKSELQLVLFKIDLGDGLFIRGDIRTVTKQGARPVLVICHGFKGFKDWGFFPYVSTWFAERGFYTVSFNFSCNGVNVTDFDELDKFGANTYSREQADLAALVSELLTGNLPLSRLADSERIYLLGHSRGGGNSIIFSADRPEISAVVTWNTIAAANLFDRAFEEEARRNGIAYTENARTKQLMPIRAQFFEDLEQRKERFDIPASLSTLQVPVLLIQGDRDSERIVRGSEILRQAAPRQTHMTVLGANHGFGAVHPFAGTTPQLEKALQLTYDFLEQLQAGNN